MRISLVRYQSSLLLTRSFRVREIPHDGLIRYFGYLNQERVVVCGPKSLSQLLVTNHTSFHRSKSHAVTSVRIIGSQGLLLSHGQQHKTQRRIMQPAFNYRHVKNLYPEFWLKASEALKTIVAECGEQKTCELDIGTIANRTTLDVIFKSGMGHEFNAISNPQNDLVQTYEALFTPHPNDGRLSLIGRFIPLQLLIKIPLKRTRFIDQSAEYIRQVCRELIAARKAQFANEKATRNDLLSIILQNEEAMESKEIEDQLMTFLVAGHETSTAALTWTTYLLARHPEIQDRLREEVRAHLPCAMSDDASVTSETVDSMVYLQAVCAESLRYFAPLPMTSRQAAHNTTLQDQFIPEGTHLIWVPWATNFDPKHWSDDDLDEFRPERWLVAGSSDDEKSQQRISNGGAKTNYANLTFGHGPRDCIGKDFARGEFATVLAAWVSKLSFELVDPKQADERNLRIKKTSVTARPMDFKIRVNVLPDY